MFEPLNMSALKKMMDVFQLYPLSFGNRVLDHGIPAEAVECSKWQ
jgi:hypothetical protein